MYPHRCYIDIEDERQRQDEKWGVQNHNDLKWLAILMEEVGEVAKDMLKYGGDRRELVQVAAVAVAWMEAIDRRQTQK